MATPSEQKLIKLIQEYTLVDIGILESRSLFSDNNTKNRN